jgi:hypothetical protein
MKNNTKVRLHLSKKLFESLTKEIIKEAKANDGYTVAVKQPKTPKQSKSQADSPEVQKTDAEAMMGEAGAPPMPPVPGKNASDKLNLTGVNTEITDAKTFAKAILDIAKKLESKEGFKPESNPSIKRAMDALRVVSGGAPAMPPVPGQGPKKPAMPPVPPSKPKMPPVPGKMEEMEMNVAEEGQLNELDPGTSWEGIAAGMAAIGLAPLAIEKMHQWWKKKYPESYKKAQGLSRAIDRQAGGNEPGQGHGVDPKKTFGPQNEKNNIKEYEQHYRMVNGECRRYNDEGEYTVVSSHHCR